MPLSSVSVDYLRTLPVWLYPDARLAFLSPLPFLSAPDSRVLPGLRAASVSPCLANPLHGRQLPSTTLFLPPRSRSCPRPLRLQLSAPGHGHTRPASRPSPASSLPLLVAQPIRTTHSVRFASVPHSVRFARAHTVQYASRTPGCRLMSPTLSAKRSLSPSAPPLRLQAQSCYWSTNIQRSLSRPVCRSRRPASRLRTALSSVIGPVCRLVVGQPVSLTGAVSPRSPLTGLIRASAASSFAPFRSFRLPRRTPRRLHRLRSA